MKTTPKQYAISLYEATKSASKEEAPELVANFIKLLRTNNDFSKVNRIINEYHVYYRKQKGIAKIKVSSNEKLSPATTSGIMKHFDKQVEMEEAIDENLLGGITLEIDDSILIDGSVKKKLETLRESII